MLILPSPLPHEICICDRIKIHVITVQLRHNLPWFQKLMKWLHTFAFINWYLFGFSILPIMVSIFSNMLPGTSHQESHQSCKNCRFWENVKQLNKISCIKLVLILICLIYLLLQRDLHKSIKIFNFQVKHMLNIKILSDFCTSSF